MVGIRKQNRDHKRTLWVKGCKVTRLVFCSMYLFSEHARKKREGSCHSLHLRLQVQKRLWDKNAQGWIVLS